MAVLYEDARIVCDDDAITIHTYYFPWGSRRIPYITIRTFEERSMGLLTGQLRIWGTGDFKHWYHYDPKRPSKTRALVGLPCIRAPPARALAAQHSGRPLQVSPNGSVFPCWPAAIFLPLPTALPALKVPGPAASCTHAGPCTTPQYLPTTPAYWLAALWNRPTGHGFGP